MSNGAKDIIDSLNYAGYRHNRLISPHVAPKEYSSIYADWEEFEIRFQMECVK